MNFNLFISYSTEPDYNLAVQVESFLESFNKRLKGRTTIILKELQVCRDGSDFHLHRLIRKSEKQNDIVSKNSIENILVEYLMQSDFLLVLCSKNSSDSTYVDFEIEWFIKNKGKEKILIALTESEIIDNKQLNFFPKRIIKNEIHLLPFYDFRGCKKLHKEWHKVRDFDEELINLAAHLNETSSGNLLPPWRRQEAKNLKKRQYFLICFSLVLILLLILATIFWRKSVKSANDTKDALIKVEKSNTAERRQKEIAEQNLKRYKLEEFDRSIRNGDVYVDANLFELALSEYMVADSIAKDNKYKFLDLISNKKTYLNKKMKYCKDLIQIK